MVLNIMSVVPKEKDAASKGALATAEPAAGEVLYEPKKDVYLGSFSLSFPGNLASIIDEETYASSIARINDAMRIPPGGSYKMTRNIALFLRLGTLIPQVLLMMFLLSDDEGGVPAGFYYNLGGIVLFQLIAWVTLGFARNQWQNAFKDMVAETTAVISVLNSEQNGLAEWTFSPPQYRNFSRDDQLKGGCEMQFAAVMKSTAPKLNVMKMGAQQV